MRFQRLRNSTLLTVEIRRWHTRFVPDTQHPLDEPVSTVDELAKQLKMHRSTVTRLFIDEPGVIRYGHSRLRGKKQYYTLRIPASVVQRVIGRMKVA